MSGPWQSTPSPDADIRACGKCGADVVTDHDPACEHGVVACPGCGHASACPQCSVAAEREMFRTMEYDPRKDPFVDATPEAKASDDAYWVKTSRGWWDLGRGPRPAGEDAAS